MPRRDNRRGPGARRLRWLDSDPLRVIGASSLLVRPKFIAPTTTSASQRIAIENLETTQLNVSLRTEHNVNGVQYASANHPADARTTATTWEATTILPRLGKIDDFDATLVGQVSDLTSIPLIAGCRDTSRTDALTYRGRGAIRCV